MITELEFKSLAGEGYNRIPLMAEAFADLETPLSLYLKLAHGGGSGKPCAGGCPGCSCQARCRQGAGAQARSRHCSSQGEDKPDCGENRCQQAGRPAGCKTCGTRGCCQAGRKRQARCPAQAGGEQNGRQATLLTGLRGSSQHGQ